MTAALDATVLVCTRGRPAMLADTVRSVLEAAQVPRELLVVDQSDAPAGMRDELAALAGDRGCSLTYLHRPGRGLSRARNAGLRAAAADVVVLLDDDMLVEPGWLEPLVAQSGPRTVVTGRVLAGPPEGAGRTVPPAALVTRGEPSVVRGRQATDVVQGSTIALPRAAVLALGGYDERLGAGTRFGGGEDNDMGLRLLDAGFEVRHAPAAVTLHRAWRTPRGRARMRWAYGRGKGAFYAKHLRRDDPYARRRLVADAATRLRAIARALPRSPGAAGGHALYLAGLLSGACDWLVRERRRTVAP